MTNPNFSNPKERNGGLHSLDLMDANEIIHQLPTDAIFRDRDGNLSPPRASEERKQIGVLRFVANHQPTELPVDEIRLTGLANPELVRRQIDMIYASDPNTEHCVFGSPITYGVLKDADFATDITPDNPVGFAIPAGIKRNEERQIIAATRADQPQPKALQAWDEDEVRDSRERLLSNQQHFSTRIVNYTTEPVTFSNGTTLERLATTEPDYDPEVIGYTDQNIPIAIPHLKGLAGQNPERHTQLVSPRTLPILRRLLRPDLVGRSFMVSPERNKQGFLTGQIGRLAVFHKDSLELLTYYTSTS